MATENASSRHFVLVHGSCHGAWCWYKLVTLLEEAGHKVTALDLAASGRNLVPFEDLQTIDDYHEPLYSYMTALSPEDTVILVGHSYGGFAVSSAMERFPTKIALGVFISAYMVGPDLTAKQIAERLNLGPDSFGDSQITIDDNQNVSTILFGPMFLSSALYQLSPSEDLTLAKLLVRVARFFNDDKSRQELLVSKENYGSVPRAYFIGGQDIAFPVEVQRWQIENNPPNEAREIEGADHMVMISKPQELCSNLLEVAMKYN